MFRQDLFLESPWMNAAGMLGFAPSALALTRWPLEEPMGAFVTNPVSFNARTPAAERAVLNNAGSLLLHSGLPNPGIQKVLRKNAERWAQSNQPIWVHLIGTTPNEIHQMIHLLEGREGVMAVELNLPPDCHDQQALALVEAAYGELPLVLHLPITAANESWITQRALSGVSAISLGAPRGVLPTAAGKFSGGRCYGSALFPLTLAALQTLRRLDVPIIAGAGIYRQKDAKAVFSAGAVAVQLDMVLWRGWMD